MVRLGACRLGEVRCRVQDLLRRWGNSFHGYYVSMNLSMNLFCVSWVFSVARRLRGVTSR